MARAHSLRDKRFARQLSSRFAGALTMAFMLLLAAGVVALECGFYKAFDDNELKMDASIASSALALLGTSGSDSGARASNSSTLGLAR